MLLPSELWIYDVPPELQYLWLLGCLSKHHTSYKMTGFMWNLNQWPNPDDDFFQNFGLDLFSERFRRSCLKNLVFFRNKCIFTEIT